MTPIDREKYIDIGTFDPLKLCALRSQRQNYSQILQYNYTSVCFWVMAHFVHERCKA